MGTYVETNLTPNERVVHQAKNHWIIFISPRAVLSLGLLPLIDWFTNEFAITNRRILIKEGLFSRRTIEMNLGKVESVGVDQTIFGRLMGYGCLVIIGTGGTKEHFHNISSPLEFRQVFQRQLEEH